MSYNKFLLLAMSLTLVSGQRPSFAGSRPIGFPEVLKPTTESLGNRFGEDDVSTTTMRLPIEANGDRDLVDRLSKLPVDQQPFWFINWQALEAHRQSPQTFPQKPNVFVDPSSSNQAQTNSNPMPNNQGVNQPPPNFNQGQMTFTQGQMTFNRPPPNSNQGQMNVNQPQTNSNQASNDLSNRFSDMDLASPATTARSPTLEELYNAQRIKPVKNADGTTSWQIMDKSVVEALEKIQKNQGKL